MLQTWCRERSLLNMVIIKDYSLEYKSDSGFYKVRSYETVPCPYCDGFLNVCGSRKRGLIKQEGSGQTLVIRRLQCADCNTIHHELPDIIVPYKRYGAANGFHATVVGSEDYKVEIEIKDGRVYDMWCSCPYAEDGTYCKHMAAVLYECEGAEGEKKAENTTWEQRFFESMKELTAVIDKIPEDELRSILTQLAQENESFRNHIMTKYSSSVSENQMMRLKKEIANIGYIYSGRSGFIDWRNAGDYIAAMENFLYHNVQEVIDKGCYMQAFELTNDVFIKIGNQDMDDSDGGTTMVANACYEFWKQILDQCNESDKKKMFQWFEKHQTDGTVIDFMEDYISDFLMNEFHDKELLERKLQMLDELIARAGEKTDCGNWWSVHYGYENNILKRLELMRELDYPEEEIREYRRNNWRFSAIRKLEIEECLSEGKITEVSL